MAFYTDLKNVHRSRTIKPLYGRTQATPQAAKLRADFRNTFTADVYPGSVMTRVADNRVIPCDGTTTPYGLCGNWIAPTLGIDEVTHGSGDWDVTLFVLGNDAVYRIEAPAFDSTADWIGAYNELKAGQAVYLKANKDALLTLEAAHQTQTANTVLRLIDVEAPGDKAGAIIVSGLL